LAEAKAKEEAELAAKLEQERLEEAEREAQLLEEQKAQAEKERIERECKITEEDNLNISDVQAKEHSESNSVGKDY